VTIVRPHRGIVVTVRRRYRETGRRVMLEIRAHRDRRRRRPSWRSGVASAASSTLDPRP